MPFENVDLDAEMYIKGEITVDFGLETELAKKRRDIHRFEAKAVKYVEEEIAK